MEGTSVQNLRVLIIEDDGFQRRILKQVLKGLGFNALDDAETGRIGEAKLALRKFGVVISDVQMPVMNGLELLKRVRSGETGAARDTPFIIQTNFSNTEVLGAAMALDANGFLVKPIKPVTVLEKINLAIGEHIPLQPVDYYLGVKTHLASLGEENHSDKPKRPSAAISLSHHDNSSPANGREIHLDKLQVDMVLARDMRSKDGALMLKSGQRLSQPMINRIKEIRELLANHVFLVNE